MIWIRTFCALIYFRSKTFSYLTLSVADLILSEYNIIAINLWMTSKCRRASQSYRDGSWSIIDNSINQSTWGLSFSKYNNLSRVSDCCCTTIITFYIPIISNYNWIINSRQTKTIYGPSILNSISSGFYSYHINIVHISSKT